MNYLRGFAPWIAYSLVAPFGWQWAGLVALLLSIASLVGNRRAGVRVDGHILDFAMIAYFAVLTGVAFTATHSPLQAYDGPMSLTWLALVAATSLAIGYPFTLGIARRSVPANVADSPRFRHTNVVITSVWTASFVFAAAAGFVCVTLHATTPVQVVCQVVALGAPAIFTHRYVRRVRAHHTEADAAVIHQHRCLHADVHSR